MSRFQPSHRFAAGTAGRIVELLRHSPQTIDDLASALHLTRTAVRAQLTALMSNGIVEPQGVRKGPSKPARLFAVTAEAEQQLSKAYVPVLTHLLMALSRRMGPEDLDELMLEVGQSLGPPHPASGTIRERVENAARVVRDLGGLVAITEEKGRLVLLGRGCPLAVATAEAPQACSVITGLLSRIIGARVTSCCEQYDRKRCCFEVEEGAA